MAAGGRYEFGHYRLDVRAHLLLRNGRRVVLTPKAVDLRSEEHTSELQSRLHLVCRLLLEKKKSRLYEALCICGESGAAMISCGGGTALEWWNSPRHAHVLVRVEQWNAQLETSQSKHIKQS